ncbi:MAG: hypothetical protein GY866_40700, partial [Proteobacteria bacterium]|nr:hypothetical protein [Pseudomonadota bacterium]
MKGKFLFLLIVVFSLIPFSASADQFYGGLGLYPSSGQPDFVADGILNINLAYETESLWRLSFTNTSFKHKDEDSVKLKSMIIGAERMWVNKIRPGFTLVGGFGPGVFSTTGEGQGSSGSGMAFGLVATGSLRYALDDKMFIGAALHYK